MRSRLTARSLETPRCGAAVVEAAFVLPVFFLVLLGIIEFGRAMMVAQMVTNAARQGARSSIIDGSTNADLTTSVRTLLHDTLGIAAADVSVTITVEPASGNPDPVDDLSRAMPRDMCQVSVAVPYRKVGYVAGQFLQAANIRGACAMRHE